MDVLRTQRAAALKRREYAQGGYTQPLTPSQVEYLLQWNEDIRELLFSRTNLRPTSKPVGLYVTKPWPAYLVYDPVFSTIKGLAQPTFPVEDI